MELSEQELAVFESQIGMEIGENSSERTYVEVRTISDILASTDVDRTHVGMIMSVLHQINDEVI